MRTDGIRTLGVSFGFIKRVAEEVGSIETITGAMPVLIRHEDNGEREDIAVKLVTARFSPGLGTRMQLGRGFDADDHRADAEPVVIVSDAFWREHYGGRELSAAAECTPAGRTSARGQRSEPGRHQRDAGPPDLGPPRSSG